MTTPPLLRAPRARVDVTFLPRQIGLALAVKHRPNAAFAWELLAVVGPWSIAAYFGRRMRP